jgi:hypothetical protein
MGIKAVSIGELALNDALALVSNIPEDSILLGYNAYIVRSNSKLIYFRKIFLGNTVTVFENNPNCLCKPLHRT